ncbi:hypothetical protein WMY93_016147 [Mugilogobius chulae]|uniref:Photoreceptor cilium actin regulator n=1 Tax=Mugilogobius chulae TaxID=88201 RepID=A0AAW0NSN9_9GOBI
MVQPVYVELPQPSALQRNKSLNPLYPRLPLSKLSPADHTPDQDCQIAVDLTSNVKEDEIEVTATERISEIQETDEVKATQRRPKTRKTKSHRKLRKSSITKVDFPPHMVRAHQAAYAFLNPNISKFETLLELLDQATQTQLSIQPVMSALVLRFEEINQALEEMAEEGELMLKEHGEYMALPSGMMGPNVISAMKSGDNKHGYPDPPLDLLQQLLQHSTEKMKHTGGSFKTRRHRGSAGSGSSNSGANIRAVLPCNSINEPNEEEEEEDDDEEDDDMPIRKRSNSSPPDPTQQPKPPSVKRLINSFSNPLTNVRTRKPNTPAEGAQVWTENKEDPDEDILPPPPPEVLMDNSFQITENMTGNEKESQSCNLSAINKRQGLPHRMKATVELLPNRASIKAKTLKLFSASPEDAILGPQERGELHGAALDPDSSLYQQARAIIHIRSAAGPLQPPLRSDSTDAHEGDMTFSLPVIAPPVSRVRLPPSGPAVCHRHPSPPVRPQSSSRPGSPKTIARATDNTVEQIIPSVSFRDARSVFCQNETPIPPHWSSCGASVLPKPWGEGSRGRTGSRAMDSPRRTQSEHRPAITIRTGGTKRDL